jgi:hypothetical protein
MRCGPSSCTRAMNGHLVEEHCVTGSDRWFGERPVREELGDRRIDLGIRLQRIVFWSDYVVDTPWHEVEARAVEAAVIERGPDVERADGAVELSVLVPTETGSFPVRSPNDDPIRGGNRRLLEVVPDDAEEARGLIRARQFRDHRVNLDRSRQADDAERVRVQVGPHACYRLTVEQLTDDETPVVMQGTRNTSARQVTRLDFGDTAYIRELVLNRTGRIARVVSVGGDPGCTYGRPVRDGCGRENQGVKRGHADDVPGPHSDFPLTSEPPAHTCSRYSSQAPHALARVISTIKSKVADRPLRLNLSSQHCRGGPIVGARRGLRRELPRALQVGAHRPARPWRGLDHVEFATLSYIDWFNHRRLHGQITDGPGYTTPAAYEADHYRQQVTADPAVTQLAPASTEPGAVHGHARGPA